VRTLERRRTILPIHNRDWSSANVRTCPVFQKWKRDVSRLLGSHDISMAPSERCAISSIPCGRARSPTEKNTKCASPCSVRYDATLGKIWLKKASPSLPPYAAVIAVQGYLFARVATHAQKSYEPAPVLSAQSVGTDF
jgi:hypothetical protein